MKWRDLVSYRYYVPSRIILGPYHHKLSNIHQQLSDDDGPGTKERVEGQEVQNLGDRKRKGIYVKMFISKYILEQSTTIKILLISRYKTAHKVYNWTLHGLGT